MIPVVSKYVGPKYLELAKLWLPSVAKYGAVGALLGLWMTEWKVVNRYIPFYGSKYDEKIDQ